MSGMEKFSLLSLMANDATAIRMFYIYKLMESLINHQKQSIIDITFSFISGFVGIITLLTYFQFPTGDKYYLIIVSIISIIIVYSWLSKRRNKGPELLERAYKFGIYLDETRRYAHELQITLEFLKNDPIIDKIKDQIKKRLEISLNSVTTIMGKLTEADYILIGESKSQIENELELYKRIM